MQTAQAQALTLPALALDDYRIAGVEQILTPALAVYTDKVEANLSTTLNLLNGNGDRWRPHVKTSKLASAMRRIVERGIHNFKCSTTLELKTVCEVGAQDVLLAYPAVGANAARVCQLAEQFAAVRLSALVENGEQIEAWRGSRLGIFMDVNPGMDRTGIEQDRVADIIRLAKEIQTAGLEFRGLHYYDGQLSKYELTERETVAHRGYDQLMKLIAALRDSGIEVGEVITAGTPAFPCSLSYAPFRNANFVHRVSPGTVVYSDCTSLAQLPDDWPYQPAAVVLSTVVSRPTPERITCDGGHKTVSADSGVPTCAVIGHNELLPARPSEEHLPMEVSGNVAPLAIGEVLYLVPRHVCPTVNNFDYAVIVEGGRIIGVEPVTARGRERPLAE